jgi:predicted SAM-dependent methyltransferase
MKALERLIAKQKAKKFLKNKPLKLHLGCGTIYKDGWVNIDNNSDNNIKKLDLNWDLRYKLPFPDNSVDFIYNEHFLEHLTPNEGGKALRDFLRVLKWGGVMRIAMPSLEADVDAYNSEAVFIQRKKDLKSGGHDFDWCKTRAEYINTCFRAWGHKWNYDWEELERRLREVGATNIKQCELRKSDIPELVDVETREESTLIAEVRK